MPDVPTIVSPIVQEDSKPRGSRFFMKRGGKPTGNNRAKAQKDKQKISKSHKTSKPAAARKTAPVDRYALLEKLLSPGLSRRMRYRLANEIDVNNYSPVHPCELDLFSSPAVKISHFKDVSKSRWRVRQCSLQKLRSDR